MGTGSANGTPGYPFRRWIEWRREANWRRDGPGKATINQFKDRTGRTAFNILRWIETDTCKIALIMAAATAAHEADEWQ